MIIIHRIKQDDNDQQDFDDSQPDFFPSDADVATEVKHDGNKTNYANQVSVPAGDEEE